MRRISLIFCQTLLGLACFGAMAAVGYAWLRQVVPDVWEPKAKPTPDPQLVRAMPPAVPHEASIPWLRDANHPRNTALARAVLPWAQLSRERMAHVQLSAGVCLWQRDLERELPQKMALYLALPLAVEAWRGVEFQDLRRAIAARPGPAHLLDSGSCPWRSLIDDPPRVDLLVASVPWPAGRVKTR